jgi:hypothetical protein
LVKQSNTNLMVSSIPPITMYLFPVALVTRTIRPVGGMIKIICSFERPAWMRSRQTFAILKILMQHSFPDTNRVHAHPSACPSVPQRDITQTDGRFLKV